MTSMPKASRATTQPQPRMAPAMDQPSSESLSVKLAPAAPLQPTSQGQIDRSSEAQAAELARVASEIEKAANQELREILAHVPSMTEAQTDQVFTLLAAGSPKMVAGMNIGTQNPVGWVFNGSSPDSVIAPSPESTGQLDQTESDEAEPFPRIDTLDDAIRWGLVEPENLDDWAHQGYIPSLQDQIQESLTIVEGAAPSPEAPPIDDQLGGGLTQEYTTTETPGEEGVVASRASNEYGRYVETRQWWSDFVDRFSNDLGMSQGQVTQQVAPTTPAPAVAVPIKRR
jgi:hypothetical protein